MRYLVKENIILGFQNTKILSNKDFEMLQALFWPFMPKDEVLTFVGNLQNKQKNIISEQIV